MNTNWDYYWDVRGWVEEMLRDCWVNYKDSYGAEGIPENDLLTLTGQRFENHGKDGDIDPLFFRAILHELRDEGLVARDTGRSDRGPYYRWRPFGLLRRIDYFDVGWETIEFPKNEKI